MDDTLLIFLATVYGETAASSPAAWRAIASVIKNRVGRREWAKWETVAEIIAHTGFDAYSQQNAPYREALAYFKVGLPHDNPRFKLLAETVTPIYLDGPRIPDIVLYYSPKAQAWLHEHKPEQYHHDRPAWNWDELEQVPVEGAEGDDFAFFKYIGNGGVTV